MGRRRRVSSSTVSSTDLRKTVWAKETAVLKPVVAGEELPEFVLTDATIYAKDGKMLANPLFLNQSTVGPVVVRGKLEPVERVQDKYLVNKSVRTANIEIPACTQFSIGYDELTLWVAGHSGWYEIRPSPAYEAMFIEITEAITLYYEALNEQEAYELKLREYQDEQQNVRARKKTSKKRPPEPPMLEDFFFRYAVGAGDGVTRSETEARYQKWAPFLAEHIPKEQAVTWEGTPFAAWIKDVAEKSKVKIAELALRAPPVPQNPPRSRRSTSVRDASGSRSRSQTTLRSRRRESSHDVEMTDAVPLKTQPISSELPILRKGKEKVETPVPLPPEYHLARQASNQNLMSQATTSAQANPTPSRSPQVDALLEVIQEHVAGKHLMKVTPSSIFTKLYMKCTVGAYRAASEVVHYYAKDILARLGSEWKGTPFEAHLKAVSKIPLVPEHTTLDRIRVVTTRRPKGGSKSSLKAVEDTHSVDSDSRRTSRLSRQILIDDDESGEEFQPNRGGRKSGKAAGLRLVGSKKRPASAMSPDYDSGTGSRRGRKSARLSRPGTDDEDEEAAISDGSDTVSSSTSEGEGDQVLFPSKPPPGHVRYVVTASSIPSTVPYGPLDTWVCEEKGCEHVVRAADTKEGQDLIQEHFLVHQAQWARINLAKKESESHGEAPINNLLEKLMEIGRQRIEKEGKNRTLNGQPLPAPIKRSQWF